MKLIIRPLTRSNSETPIVADGIAVSVTSVAFMGVIIVGIDELVELDPKGTQLYPAKNDINIEINTINMNLMAG